MTKINVETAKTSELLAFYNEHSGEAPVKRFSDRLTAERRVEELLSGKKEAPVEKEKVDGARSIGIAKSWTNPKIAAKRAERSAVEVNGVRYKSVPAAYRALGIPLNGVIQFRMLLKETKTQKESGRTWKIVG